MDPTTNCSRLRVELGPLTLSNPILTASGTFGYGPEMADFFDLNLLGGVVVKSVSLHPRVGNPPPRIVETASGILNSIGLPNGGLDQFVQQTLPQLKGKVSSLIVNIAGESVDEFMALAEAIDDLDGIDAIEVNLSCPNVGGGGFPFAKDPKLTEAVISGVRSKTQLPLIAKLSPNVTDSGEIAKGAEAGGADALTLINTPLGMVVDWRARRPVLGGIHGGLSGPAIKPIALYHVSVCARATRLPIIGVGGIESADDVLDFVVTGASAVQVGTANFRNPMICVRILEELPRLLDEAGVGDLSELRGVLRAGS